MIRVVVVDDDFRIADIHAAYVDKVDGFQAIAQAHTAAEAAGAVDRLRPDLLLLDLYLPDEHGLDLVARLRREGHPPVDVIVITAAKDADSVRAAMQGGALHYLLKPFSFPALRDKLLSYTQMRSRLSALHQPDQRNLDRVFGALRTQDQLAGAKGRSAHTLDAVRAAAHLGRAGALGRGGSGDDRDEPGHGAALPQPPARDRARRDQAPLRQRRASRTSLPVVPGG